MKVVVTGGGGYIGTTLVPTLLEEKHEVTVIDRFFFGEELLHDHQNLVKINADVRNYDYSLLKGADAVIDLVGISNDPSGDMYPNETWDINFKSRFNTASYAKELGVGRYILPSSCSVYGFQDNEVSELSKVNPLTTYASANYEAEKNIVGLADDNFTAVILRQATVFGFSPRMRFDLVVNEVTYNAWKNQKVTLRGNGEQWRPLVHVKDTSRAIMFMLSADKEKVNGEIFNVGSAENGNYMIKDLAVKIADTLGLSDAIERQGGADNRSYKVNFNKISKLGFSCRYSLEDGISGIYQKLQDGSLDKTDKNVTLQWYKHLAAHNKGL